MNVFRSDLAGTAVPLLHLESNQVSADLYFERSVSASRRLAAFRRNAATWELLLLLAAADGSDETGVYQTVDKVQSIALGSSALLKFIREQTDAGNLHLEESEHKRSKRLIRLDPALMEELSKQLSERNRVLM
ncbi:hypothetical protein [Pararhodobacter sp.]|jgi:hypothetical protein|uniref:hypothetical protein n=1 Tax=Pararhodobacter sp. TaxID=2127056 RepID=UPI002FDE2F78